MIIYNLLQSLFVAFLIGTGTYLSYYVFRSKNGINYNCVWRIVLVATILHLFAIYSGLFPFVAQKWFAQNRKTKK